ncbi:MAG TPA: tyrosine/phenylalanine carboxypeptidase domain-containing protein [Ktedonobacteraceae bacterium]|nr:tyrosine/phenylalanine carboxypeptidase domain-containing protein [Ktedonobacteraceae bacterium]
MLTGEVQQAMAKWLHQATPPEQQLDRRWIGRYRELNAQDSFWWLTWAGPFTEEERQQWDRLFQPPVAETAKEQLAPLLTQSRERELAAALSEQREPRLHYPAIEIDEVRRRIVGFEQLAAEIEREEANEIVRRLYLGTITDDITYLRLIEATSGGNTEQYWVLNRRLFHEPTSDEMTYVLSRLRRLLQQGFERPDTAESSQHLLQFLQERLHLSLDLSVGRDDPPVVREYDPTQWGPGISAEAAKHFFETILRDSGYEGWRVMIDTAGSGARVESGLRQVLLSNERFALNTIRHLLAHELAGHVARSFAGEHSPVGLLGIGTQGYSPTEEGLALYHEREATKRTGYPFSDAMLWLGTLATGLASGVVTPPQTFLSLYSFFDRLFLLHRRLWRPGDNMEAAQEQAHDLALWRCLDTYRGVPDLEQAGICYLQDVIYLRGLLLIDRLVAEDETIVDRLAVGKVSSDLLPILRPLHMVPSPQPLRQLAYDPGLDSSILSFEASRQDTNESM